MTSPRDPLAAHLLSEVHRKADNVHADTADLTAAVKAAREFSGVPNRVIGGAAGHSESWVRRVVAREEGGDE